MTENNKVPEGFLQVQSGRSGLKQQIRTSFQSGIAVTLVPKWAAYAVIAWQARLSIEAMTGKRGIASLLERFGREASYWEVVCWVAGILGILFGMYSRHLLRRHLAHDLLRLDAIERRLGLVDDSPTPLNPSGAPPVEKS